MWADTVDKPGVKKNHRREVLASALLWRTGNDPDQRLCAAKKYRLLSHGYASTIHDTTACRTCTGTGVLYTLSVQCVWLGRY